MSGRPPQDRAPHDRAPDEGDCRTFRELLEEAMRSWIDGRPATGALSWHVHLVTCDACRALVAEEHAVDELLALLRDDPAAQLPPGTARRVLVRLEDARRTSGERSLDGLLDLAAAPAPPADLGARVLAGLDDEREAARLDARLERLLGVVPEPQVPADLAARVRSALAAERSGPSALDRLLDAVPAPDVPANLTSSVLGALREERVASARERRPSFARGSVTPPGDGSPSGSQQASPKAHSTERAPVLGGAHRFGLALAAAAALVVAFLLWKASDDVREPGSRTEVARVEPPRFGGGDAAELDPPTIPEVAQGGPTLEPAGTTPRDTTEPVPVDEAPPEDLLLALDVLERWDDVTGSDLDVLLAAVDVTDEDYLIDGAFDDAVTDGGNAR